MRYNIKTASEKRFLCYSLIPDELDTATSFQNIPESELKGLPLILINSSEPNAVFIADIGIYGYAFICKADGKTPFHIAQIYTNGLPDNNIFRAKAFSPSDTGRHPFFPHTAVRSRPVKRGAQ